MRINEGFTVARGTAEKPRTAGLLDHELIIDNFAGGGGASEGLEQAFGRPVDVAINHDPEAIAMHQVNHPYTKHYCESVWDVDPIEVTGNRPVGLVWLSPDCCHFSKAKGGKPVEKKIRGLAWITLRWVALTKPRIVALENVEELKTWGPLIVGADGFTRPDPARKGETFRSFIRQLEGHGYKVEHRELRACDFGAPTIRKRLFILARRDGLPIVWPAPTHGDPKSKEVLSGKLLPWRTAAECIEWNRSCPSIFERKKPLAEATQRRIAKGLRKFVFEAAEPFIVQSRAKQVTAGHEKNADAPYHTCIGQTGRGDNASRSAGTPLSTIVSKNEHLLLAPTLVQVGYGERKGQAPRALDLHKPLGTVVGTGKHAVAMAFVAKHYTGVTGIPPTVPLGTITTQDHHSVVEVELERVRAADAPMRGRAWFANGAGNVGKGSDYDALYARGLSEGDAAEVCSALDDMQPLDNSDQVYAFLIKFYSQGGQWQGCNEPMHTIPTKHRLGLVMIKGDLYRIVDIGMRMLQPSELFRAQGFPEDYIFTHTKDGKSLAKDAQVRMCGNSVSPYMSKALALANFEHERKYSTAA